ncbi:uncharacterized protein LOC132715830 [Ruditapes philippinarum]|uniref:uncharacterized protein LOC132715830 n=1 Tax=Ruditapes philippinarum TaxID=129788 RepID=UPI00295B31C3|nr:uncharacterized protein LOC132715830 [Ruditapes philippinarum]
MLNYKELVLASFFILKTCMLTECTTLTEEVVTVDLLDTNSNVNVSLNCTGSSPDLAYYIINRIIWDFVDKNNNSHRLTEGFYPVDSKYTAMNFGRHLSLVYFQSEQAYIFQLKLYGVTEDDEGYYRCSEINRDDDVIAVKGVRLIVNKILPTTTTTTKTTTTNTDVDNSGETNDKVDIPLDCHGSSPDFNDYALLRNIIKWDYIDKHNKVHQITEGLHPASESEYATRNLDSGHFKFSHFQLDNGLFNFQITLHGVNAADEGIYRCTEVDHEGTIIQAKNLSLSVPTMCVDVRETRYKNEDNVTEKPMTDKDCVKGTSKTKTGADTDELYQLKVEREKLELEFLRQRIQQEKDLFVLKRKVLKDSRKQEEPLFRF